MKFQNFILYFIILLISFSCSKKRKNINYKRRQFRNANDKAYNEGLKEFNRGDVFFAVNLTKLNFYILNQYGHQDQL